MDDYTRYSHNPQLNKMLESVIKEVRQFAEAQIRHLQQLTQIGIALSAEKDITRLLEMIIDEAMRFTHADAGTLYTVDEEAKCLHFEIIKNLSLKTQLGGKTGGEINMPPVPLQKGRKPNLANVSSCCVLKREIVNIPDVYSAEGFDFSGPRKYDTRTGYRSQSMLVIPLENHENEIIGVLQLLNATDPESGKIIPFDKKQEGTIKALASQAAIALENARLITELRKLLHAFIESIATAIDEKSPYTGGHISRVTEITMMIAHKINETNEGPFAAVSFNEDELEELRVAAWLHDVGKITTPEYVADKSRKLETIFDRIELVKTRFELIREIKEKEALKRKLTLLQEGKTAPGGLEEIDAQFSWEISRLDEDFAFIAKCNLATEMMNDQDLERLKRIGAQEYELNGQRYAYLTEDECYNLCIRRGTLTPEERKVIENHALVSVKILRQLPFPKKLARVPDYAGGHHERLDGTGYPFGLTSAELPLQARIMALADVFEALTARDRPYKKPMKLSQAVKILGNMCRENHIDPNLYHLFINSGLYLEYAQRELNKDQIDVSESAS
jgi:HD-GYP domain-containing protein (c-di-GMP phosphodiesterase class II)